MTAAEWVRVDLAVVEKYGADAAVLLAVIAFRSHRDGAWQATLDEMVTESCLTGHKVRSALRVLRDTGLVEARRADRFKSLLSWSVSPGHAENGDIHFTGSGESTDHENGEIHFSTSSQGSKKETSGLRLVGDEEAPPARQDVEDLCERLADRVEANGSRRPTITKAWRDSCRLLLDKDDRTAVQVAKAIDWCQADEFWRGNVLSMPTLRKQYDRLRLAAQRAGAAPGLPAAQPRAVAPTTYDPEFAATLPPPRSGNMYH